MSDNVIAGGPQLRLGDLALMKLNKPYQDGTADKNFEVRLRIGIIDKPQRQKNDPIKPLESKGIINTSTGKFCIRWLEYPGGIIRPTEFGSDIEENSDRELLSFTHPIMWNSGENWMGMNYLPPVGSVVVVGFRKNNLPVMLGFLQQHYEVCDPLKLGEMMIKGYGNNKIHWKQHNELEQSAWITQGQKDQLGITSDSTVGLKIRIKAGYSENDDINDDQNDPKKRSNKKDLIELYAYRYKDNAMIEGSAIEIKPHSISFNCFVPEENVPESKFKVFNKMEMTKDGFNFSSSNNSNKSAINMGKENISFQSNNGNITNKIDIDNSSNSVSLSSTKKINNIDVKEEIKIVDKDAFINVSGNVNINAGQNLNLHANNNVNIYGTRVNFD